MVNREMRASDDDRERVAEILRDAHGQGRLGQDELLERIEATYGARTYRDLDRVISDLPVPRRPARLPARPLSAPAPARRSTAQRVVRAFLTVNWWIYAAVLALCTTIWLLVAVTQGETQGFWPLWVAGPWGMLLGFGELTYRSTVKAGTARH